MSTLGYIYDMRPSKIWGVRKDPFARTIILLTLEIFLNTEYSLSALVMRSHTLFEYGFTSPSAITSTAFLCILNFSLLSMPLGFTPSYLFLLLLEIKFCFSKNCSSLPLVYVQAMDFSDGPTWSIHQRQPWRRWKPITIFGHQSCLPLTPQMMVISKTGTWSQQGQFFFSEADMTSESPLLQTYKH